MYPQTDRFLSLFPKPLGCIESAFTVLKDNQRVKIKVCTSFCSLGPTFNLHKSSFVRELMFFTSSHCPGAPVGQQRRQPTAAQRSPKTNNIAVYLLRRYLPLKIIIGRFFPYWWSLFGLFLHSLSSFCETAGAGEKCLRYRAIGRAAASERDWDRERELVYGSTTASPPAPEPIRTPHQSGPHRDKQHESAIKLSLSAGNKTRALVYKV